MKSRLIVAVVGLHLAWLGATRALAQFQPPPNALALEDSGTLEGMQGPLILIRDSENETWLLRVGDDTKVTVTGEAEQDLLRSGMFVQVSGEIDDEGKLVKPVTELEIISALGKDEIGLYPLAAKGEEAEGEVDAEAKPEPSAEVKPLRKPEAGTFHIRGKLAVFKNGKLVIVAGRRIEGEVDEKLNVTLKLDDPTVAQIGDEVSVKAWYYSAYKPQPVRNVPGKALAEEITIKLAKPLAAEDNKRRSRRTSDE